MRRTLVLIGTLTAALAAGAVLAQPGFGPRGGGPGAMDSGFQEVALLARRLDRSETHRGLDLANRRGLPGQQPIPNEPEDPLSSLTPRSA